MASSCQKQIRRSRCVLVEHSNREKEPYDGAMAGATGTGKTGGLDQASGSECAQVVRHQRVGRDRFPPDPVRDGPRILWCVPSSKESNSACLYCSRTMRNVQRSGVSVGTFIVWRCYGCWGGCRNRGRAVRIARRHLCPCRQGCGDGGVKKDRLGSL